MQALSAVSKDVRHLRTRHETGIALARVVHRELLYQHEQRTIVKRL